MTELESYFKENSGRLVTKWNHYWEVYDKHFSRFRDKEVVILEIGVFHGGSLQLWKKYFGKNAKIYGIDIDERCKEYEEENIKIFIGSQSDRNFLRKVISEIPPVDILIDDGGHTMRQQRVSFEELFRYVKNDGVYLCEDLHTSYWLKFGGGYKRRNTFIEYSKNFIDYLNAYHYQGRIYNKVNDFTKSVNSIHYYDSIIVIEKKERKSPPVNEITGKPSYPPEAVSDTFINKSFHVFSKFVNSFLALLRLPGYSWKYVSIKFKNK